MSISDRTHEVYFGAGVVSTTRDCADVVQTLPYWATKVEERNPLAKSLVDNQWTP